MNTLIKEKINHLDLFSGVGGFSLALQRVVGEENIGYVGYSDIDKYANQVFKRRFPNAEELGSITDINTDKLPKLDLITFGFPCQDLSIAGKRGGLQANRSGLFFEAMRIVGATKPKYIIFENVKGLFSSNEGQDFDIILRTIAEFGYDGQWQLCNTRWFLPQNRERIYFVGHIRGRSRPKVFPIGEGINGNRKIKFSRKETNEKQEGVQDTKNRGGRSLPKSVKSHSLFPRSGNPNQGGTGHLEKEDGTSYCLDTGNAQAVEIRSAAIRGRENNSSGNLEIRKDDVANCILKDTNSSIVYKESNIRRLTPIECERLQGFPDNWTEGQSDTQRYKQMGNAITVDVPGAIFRKLYNKE